MAGSSINVSRKFDTPGEFHPVRSGRLRTPLRRQLVGHKTNQLYRRTRRSVGPLDQPTLFREELASSNSNESKSSGEFIAESADKVVNLTNLLRHEGSTRPSIDAVQGRAKPFVYDADLSARDEGSGPAEDASKGQRGIICRRQVTSWWVT